MNALKALRKDRGVAADPEGGGDASDEGQRPSAEVKAEIEAVEAEQQQAAERQAQLRAERDDRVLNGTDDEVDDAERRLTLEQRAAERRQRRLTDLREELDGALAREADEAKQAARREVERELAIADAFLRQTYGEHAEAIQAGLAHLETVREMISDLERRHGIKLEGPELALYKERVQAGAIGRYRPLAEYVCLPHAAAPSRRTDSPAVHHWLGVQVRHLL